MTTHPTLAIFRIPNDDGGIIQFAKLELDDEGCPESSGSVFSVGEESSYNELTYSHIVLALATEDGSQDLAWYLINDDDADDGLATVYDMEGHHLMAIIEDLVGDYLRGGATFH